MILLLAASVVAQVSGCSDPGSNCCSGTTADCSAYWWCEGIPGYAKPEGVSCAEVFDRMARHSSDPPPITLITVTGEGDVHTAEFTDRHQCEEAASLALYGKTLEERDKAAKEAAARRYAHYAAFWAKHPPRKPTLHEMKILAHDPFYSVVTSINGVMQDIQYIGDDGLVHTSEGEEYMNGPFPMNVPDPHQLKVARCLPEVAQ